MTWTVYGIKASKHGNMNINIVGAAKRYVHYMQDGKWLMFEPTDTTLFEDFIRLLRIKRKPNRK